MQQNNNTDWVDYITKQVYKNYNGRDVIIWGSYGAAVCIKERLKETYGIDTAFYVDGDKDKVDNRTVFSPECLSGKSKQYYIVVPIAFYPSVCSQLIQGGYRKDIDYYYFCDCVLRDDPDYYEDAHGNKIIGNHHGLKFAFSGFNSVIKIGIGVKLKDSIIYLHNGVEITIGDGTRLDKSCLTLEHFSKVVIAEEVEIIENHVNIGEHSTWNINDKCILMHINMNIGEQTEVFFGKEMQIITSKERTAVWRIGDLSKIRISDKGRFVGFGCFELSKKTFLKIGSMFSIQDNYHISFSKETSAIIGDDCMFSWNVILHSNDHHSIFDVVTGENINSTTDISGERRILIGNHVWIGDHVCILYNTQIGDGSIIGAMSLVKSKISNNCIAAGNPARVVRKDIAWSRKNGATDIRECGEAYVRYTEETKENNEYGC